jgi:outer membrane beta-barrel protein
MLKLIYTLALLISSAYFSWVFGQGSFSEKYTIKGSFTTENPSAVIISLQDASDALVKTESIDEKGDFTFENIAAGDYSILITSNGKTAYQGKPFNVTANVNLGLLTAEKETHLEEVTVTKAKPYIERSEGKMILNLDSNIGATGSSAFEVLEKAPGVSIDNNDNISLRGRGGIQIQIDGKPTPMSGTTLVNYLKGIPSGIIDKIEFITNPSAKYDASGSSVINIKMKKEKKAGTNGSITSAYGQGRYPKSNSSLSLNHREKKWNTFGTYSFAYREGFNKLILDRKFYENGNLTGAYEQDNFFKINFRNHILRAGADYFANPKHTFGIVVSAVSNKFNPYGKNYSDVFDENDTRVSRFETVNNSRDNWHNQSVNLNYKFAIDTTGTQLVTDFDYASYGNKARQHFTTKYLDLNNAEFQDRYLLDGDLRGDLNLFSLKSDFTAILKDKTKLETGAKSSLVNADNNLKFYDASSGVPVFDDTKSNHFIYEENINAAYVNLTKEFSKKWSGYLGLRVENTNVTGKQLVDNSHFKNDYTQVFPSALLSYAMNDNNSFELNYSRRIDRPSYEQLNPFKFFLDPTTYKEGNPYLKPQTTHSLDFTHILNQKIFTTLSFSRTADNITGVIAPSDDNPEITVQTDKNLNNVDIVGLFSILPFEITKWWSCNNSLNFYYGFYSGTIADTPIDNRGNFTFNMNAVHTFKMKNGYSAELTGNYRAREIYAYMNVDPIGYVNLGFQKKFKNRSSLKLAINDVFLTNGTTAVTQFSGYHENFKVTRDTRTAVLSYTYNFGSGNGPQPRRSGGAEDIKQRAASANG